MARRPSLGILTGISYVSGVDYFVGINTAFIDAGKNGRLMKANPELTMVSLDCDQYVYLLTSGSFQEVDDYLLAGVDKLVAAGCNTLVIASNTGHICIPAVRKAYPELDVLHIADCCAHRILDHGCRNVALLGTKPTMEEDYLTGRLAKHGIDAIIPARKEDRERIYEIICQELSYDIQREESRDYLVQIIRDLVVDGADACLLGCTELELLIQQSHIPDVPLFPSAKIHIAAAADLLLGPTANP
ncbi:MAG: amino acid racemase [Woeseiaceae bacterium]|nr:amino acid racemase [Woeseiaceae bacterium]